MRDILVTLFVLGVLPLCFRRPFIGLLVFSVLAYMRIQDLTWGFARFQRWSFLVAIVMIADATEAGARAYAQAEQPTEEGLSKLVDTIVTEKLDDGQFDESSLTFGDLTTVKHEVVTALSAYYHARVEYPDFPEAVPAEGS